MKDVSVDIVISLKNQILKKFKQESVTIFKLMESLKNNPRKGKLIASIGDIVIKEIKYKSFRFYFITQGYKLKVLSKDELVKLLIKFVRMSDKKQQQKTIEEIKQVLLKIGSSGFD